MACYFQVIDMSEDQTDYESWFKGPIKKPEKEKEILLLKEQIKTLVQENKNLKKANIFCPYCGAKIERKSFVD